MNLKRFCWRITGLIIFCALVLLTACGGGGGNDGLVQRVGPQGMTIELPAGGTLTIPAGALMEEVDIEVEQIEPPFEVDFSAISVFYRFSPEGLRFNAPATLELPAAIDTENPAELVNVAIFYTEAPGTYVRLLPSRIETDAGTVSSEILHFSEAGAGRVTCGMVQCCVEGLCQETTLAQCSLNNGLASRFDACPVSDEGAACGNVVCCSSGKLFFTLDADQCVANGFTVVENAQCDTVVCSRTEEEIASGKRPKQVSSRGECVTVSGGSIEIDVADTCNGIPFPEDAPQPTQTPRPTAQPTPVPTPQPPVAASPAPTATPTPSPSPTSSPRPPQVPEPSPTPSPSPTPEPSASPSPSPSPTPPVMCEPCGVAEIVVVEGCEDVQVDCEVFAEFASSTFPNMDPFGDFPDGTIVGSDGCLLQLQCGVSPLF